MLSTKDVTKDAPWTIGRLLNWTSEFFSTHHVPEARLSAEVLLAHVLECRRIDLYARFERTPPEDRRAGFRELVRRAARHEPVAYLVGEKEFFSLTFWVSPAVLIPRPETETLAEWVLDFCKGLNLVAPRILDLGTGSGCIAIALLYHLPGATAVATDISEGALEVASRNARRHGVEARMTILRADGVALPDNVVGDGFDVLVCNPPYIADSAMCGLEPSVRDYEPRQALTDGADGLSFYRMLARDGNRLLRSAGRMFVEIADGQARAVRQAVGDGGWRHAGTGNDRTTSSARVVSFDRQEANGLSR